MTPNSTLGHRLSPRDLALLFVVALALFLPGITGLPPTDRDESRYIVTSERMAETGDLVDLRYQDKPRYLQPAGIYWLQAAATTLLDSPGHTKVWVYRLPSLFAALAAVLMTGWAGARLFGRPSGIAAGLLLAACFLLNFESRIAKTDAVLLAAITTAQLTMMRAYVNPASGRLNAVLFWAALGVGLMIKGPVILLVSGSTFAALAAWDRNVAWAKALRPAWGWLITLAIALPWYIGIGVKTDGAFYQRALMKNFLGKAGAGEQGHKGPFGYHLSLFVLTFWPSWILFVRALGHVWRERASRPIRFLLCWVVPAWVIFELVATKLPHYVLPTFPALALLAAAALFAPPPAAPTRWGRIAFWAAIVLWVVISAVVALVAPVALLQYEQRADIVAFILGGAGFVAVLAGLWLLLARRRQLAGVGTMALGAGLVWFNTFGLAAPQLDSVWLSPKIAAAAREARGCETGVLATTPYNEPSLVFLYGREKTRLVANGAEAAEVLSADRACGVALVDIKERDAFMARASSLGLSVRPVGQISGRNYSNGRKLELTLYRAAE